MTTDTQSQYSMSLWYLAAIAVGLLSIWVTPHLPLVDYPEHVAQLALLKELQLGKTPWSEIVTINYFTPNLAIYYLGLILSTIFSITTAFKLLISFGYIAFIFTCIQLRAHFKVDPRLDWAFLLPFFGYAYKWGFITFAISAPIALFFIFLADKHAKSPSNKSAVWLSVFGLLLLEAHGLMFLFAFGIGSLLVLAHSRSMKSFLSNLVPYLILIACFAILFKLNSEFNTKLQMTDYTFKNGLAIEWGLNFKRIAYAFSNTVTRSIGNLPAVVYMLTAAIIFLTPWLLGLRPSIKNKSANIVFAMVCITILFTPHLTLGTYLIHERFALFLIPSYIFLFSSKKSSHINQNRYCGWAIRLAMPILTFGTLASLSVLTYVHFLFKQETQEIDLMLANLEPNHKVYYVISNSYSKSNYHDIYIHYPLWYQAKQGGFVEGNTVRGNFASLAPFPVRYKSGSLPKKVQPNLKNKLNINFQEFRYLIVRSKANKPLSELFDNGSCIPEILDAKGQWRIYDTKNCSNE